MRDREAIAAPKLVARVELNYRTPVLYGPELKVQLGIGRVGGSSFSITCRGIQDDTVVFDGLNVWSSSIARRSARPGSRTPTARSCPSSARSTPPTSWTSPRHRSPPPWADRRIDRTV